MGVISTVAESEVKLSYAASAFRVRAEFRAEVCLRLPSPPEDLFQRAENKLTAEQDARKIRDFMLDHKTIQTMWEVVGRRLEAGQIRPNTVLSCNIGFGVPPLAGISISNGGQGKALFLLTIKAPAVEVAKWDVDWVRTFCDIECRKRKIHGRYNFAQVLGAVHRAVNGEAATDLAIGLEPAVAPDKPFSVVGNRARGELLVIVNSPAALAGREAIERILLVASDAAKKLASAGLGQFTYFRSRLIQDLKQAIEGPQAMGLSLPMVMLAGATAATPKAGVASKIAEAAGTAAVVVPETYPGRGKLQVSIADDKMEATIANWDMKFYTDPEFEVNEEWLAQEVARNGVVVGWEAGKRTALDLMAKKQDLTGALVAVGIAGVPPSEPYIHKNYKEDKAPETSTEDSLNLRAMQQKAIVHQGQLLAEIRYKKPGRTGRDVLGKELPTSEVGELIVAIGDGVEKRADNKFYATMEGMPVIEGNTISVRSRLVIDTDVNLRSGDVRYDGDCEVKGSIDNGATVIVTGNLLVTGEIRGAFVRVGGSLEVKGGIITSQQGKVFVRNDLYADIIENSRIVCGGVMRIKKVILNSEIACGNHIELVARDSMLAGGYYAVRNFIKTAKMGFPRGAATEIKVGCDWRAELALRIRSQRLAKLTDWLDQSRQNLRELMRKNKSQLSKKNEEMIEVLKGQLERGRELMDKLQLKVDESRSKLVHDKEAFILVEETLIGTTKIEIGGVPIAVGSDVAGVKVRAKRRRGSFVVPIGEDDEPGSASADKKAS